MSAVEETKHAEQKRILACVACQSRKVKCDRVFPCSNCVRLDLHCEQAKLQPPRARRRRFPERALLDRIRHYETLLRDNGVPFTPLHPETPPETRQQEPMYEFPPQRIHAR